MPIVDCGDVTNQDGPRFGFDRINVLDHGYVRLVDHMGDDLSVARSARVSHDADWRTGQRGESDARLIHYLMENRHTSPFEHVVFTFEVKAPIFVFRQWHRHRTWSFNEISARYAELPEEFYVPDSSDIGIQSKTNHQSRDIESDGRVTPQQVAARSTIKMACEESFRTYRSLLEHGVPRELARSVLPVATYSRMFATIDLHNLLHFLDLRCHEHAQYEIRVYAQAMLSLIETIVPVSLSAWRTSRGGA